MKEQDWEEGEEVKTKEEGEKIRYITITMSQIVSYWKEEERKARPGEADMTSSSIPKRLSTKQAKITSEKVVPLASEQWASDRVGFEFRKQTDRQTHDRLRSPQ